MSGADRPDRGDGGGGLAAAESTSRFYGGVIVRLQAGSRRGTVRSDNGREIGFSWQDVRIIGADGGFSALREGMRVGFDLGRTSRGICVSTIRVFPEPFTSSTE